MRQSGFLAAAGIFALDHNRERLADDHARARALAEGAADIPGIEVTHPETNIVMLDFSYPAVSVDGVLADLLSAGVLMVRFGPRRVRAVTHLDVDDAGIAKALGALAETMMTRSRRIWTRPTRSDSDSTHG
jgi:threonine aldolase